MLDRRLTKSDCKQRSGPSGRKLTYLESWKVIDLANKIFGWDGWSCEGMFYSGWLWCGVTSAAWGGGGGVGGRAETAFACVWRAWANVLCLCRRRWVT